MNDKKPTNDRELIAALFGIARAMQNKLHDINCQCFAIESKVKILGDKHLEKCVGNIDKYTQYIYEGENAEDGTCFFPKPSEILELAAVRLVDLGETRTWSDYVGWDDRSHKFVEQNQHLVEKYRKELSK